MGNMVINNGNLDKLLDNLLATKSAKPTENVI